MSATATLPASNTAPANNAGTEDAATKQRVNAAVKKVGAIATLPEVTAKIIETVEDPRSTAQQLHALVTHDPALVTRILKVVNSSFYGLPGQIASIERAIVLLGLNAVKNIAVAASIGQMFRGNTVCEGFTARDLWSHCIGVAVVARDLARKMKLNIADEAFLAGMIHDVGILVSVQVQPDKLRTVCDRVQATGGDFCKVEREVYGMDHQALGEALTEQWRFPRSCQVVAGAHHDPGRIAAAHRDLVSVVWIADTICGHTDKAGFNLTSKHQDPMAIPPGGLKPDPKAIEAVTESLPTLMEQASSLF